MGTAPNLLVIMSDEHAPQFSGFGGHPLVRTPHLDRLAARGVLFQNAYCASPLCVPSRMAFMTGRYPHHNGAYDNGTALSSDAVTWAHLLRAAGYDAVLSGKQHFVGPDQLHGFRAQIGFDLHAQNAHGIFDWERGTAVAARPWPGVAQAGPGSTREIEVDDTVEAAALDYLREAARRERPWALNVGFIAPHFPLVVPQQYWDLYPPEAVDLPQIPEGHLERQHPVFQRMRAMFGTLEAFPEAQMRRARAAYYGLISYLDDNVGRLLGALEETGQLQNTLVIYTSDHGEMAGEHGMWRKSNFYEHSARVPLILSWPEGLPAGRRVTQTVSQLDAVAAMLEATGTAPVTPLDGESLLPLARGAPGADAGWKDEAFGEYLAHGVARPVAMLRRGRYKLIYSLDDPPLLFDLQTDPGELHDLGADPAHASVREDLRARLLARWDPVRLEQWVRRGQKERLLIRAAGGGGRQPADAAGLGGGGPATPEAEGRPARA
ncbi:MAG TPA: sulfatase-like hydrolase/transferase [Chloroflexota bacterium]|jgi:choline-sulfatase|nr:sulfatase-like hydrolase/transferase [Chloroflexota bacterium]